jgi:DDE superfamily endonuclease
MRAEAAGDPGPWRQQALLGRAQWEADALRDVVRDYVIATLADPDAVLVVDETGFLKQGRASCGVGRQYTGSAGKITNSDVRCQQSGTQLPGPASSGGERRGALRRAGGRAVETTVEQTLMRGLVTAFPCVRPGLPRSASGHRRVVGHTVRREGSPPRLCPRHCATAIILS